MKIPIHPVRHMVLAVLTLTLALSKVPSLVQAAAPSAVTLAAGQVANEVAGLRGTVDPNGASTTAYFEFGGSEGYGDSTPALDLGSTVGVLTVSNFVTCLRPNTTYHFRIVASNNGGTSYGADQVFTTSDVPDVARALDTTCLVWTGGGYSSFIRSSVTHDGVDAVASGSEGGVIGQSMASLETTVIGPGTLTFWWQGNYFENLFTFSVDSVALASVGGNAQTPWEQKMFTIGRGSHVLNWRHTFDTFYSAAVYLDQVVFIPDLSPPWITEQPSNLTVRAGLNATFTLSAFGAGTLSYQWQFDGTNVADQTNSTLLLTNVQRSHAGGYAVVITNDYGSITSRLVTLSVAIPPSIVQQPQSVTAVVGESATFTVVVTNTATLPITYRWIRNGLAFATNVLHSTTCSLTLMNVQTNDTFGVTNGPGNFRVSTVNAAGGAPGSATVTLTVLPATAPSVLAVAATNVGATSATLTGAINPHGATTAARFVYGLTAIYGNSTPVMDIGNSTNGTPVSTVVTGLLPATTYHYTVVATNSGGGTNGADLTFTTLAMPPTPALASWTWMNNWFSVSVQTANGVSYALERKVSLDDSTWVSVAQTSGNGQVQVLTDTAATNTHGFYRVGAE